MTSRALYHRALAITLAIGIATALAGCGSKEPPAAPATTPPVAPVAATPAGQAALATTASWTPEALEDLLAPIALYPDPVLSQMLIASTNPQEVLDAGNWLLQQEGVKGKALDDAAAQVGFTPPIRALVQFPETVDMMCLELGWTTELGEAFTADQAGVLDAVQRLRKQAQDVGNLQSSAQMKVETEVQEDKEVIVLKPAQPEVVYVPQYDPQTAYAPVPAAAPAPATTTTTTTTTEEKGHSTGSMVATGVLAFGAGILVSEIFDDDDDYYHPNYGYGGMPYYPPYPYRPSYGGGYYPSNSYNRPPNYNSGFQNTGNIVINTGGNRPGSSGNAYWDRYDNKPRAGATGSSGYNRNRTTSSPISAARPSRPELQDLNKRQARPMPADVKRPSPDATVDNWKGQSGYAGKKSGSGQSATDRVANAKPGYSSPAAAKSGTRQSKTPPKVQGSYAGARDADRPQGSKAATGSRDASRPQGGNASPGSRDMQRPQTSKPATASRDMQRPSSGQGDRGYGGDAQRPAPSTRPQSTQRPAPSAGGGKQHSTAVSGANRGSADRAASQRGKQSMPKGAHSKGGGNKQNRR